MDTNLNSIMRRRWPECCAWLLAVVFAVVAMACSDADPITVPDVLPPTSPSPSSWTVRGTVLEHTMSGVRPLGGVPIRVSSVPVVVDVTSGAEGFYEAHLVSKPEFILVQPASDSPYRAPCPPYAWVGLLDVFDSFDVHVVSRDLLLTTGVPPSFAPPPVRGTFRHRMFGVVSGRTSDGVRPLSGATVAQRDGADTLTDASGRYLLCLVGWENESLVEVRAHNEGFTPVQTVGPPGYGNWDFDFELTRR